MNSIYNFLTLGLLSIVLHGCILKKIPTVNFYKDMPSRAIEKPQVASNIPRKIESLGDLIISPKRRKQNLQEFLEKSSTEAFLVIKKDELIYEWYAHDSIKNTPLTSFSIAKSMLSALVGIAIEEGKIKSEEERVIDYAKNLDAKEFSTLKIKHLLQMTSGTRFSEMDVLNTTDAFAFFEDKNLRFKPGKKHEYWSAVYQLLGIVLQEAIAPQSISSYLSEKIWQPMGAGGAASWSLDNEQGIEKTFCCIQAYPMDYARFGLLYLHDGQFNNQQIVPCAWVKKSLAISEEEGSSKIYNYGWWFPFENSNEILAKGFRGQRMFINKNKETIIVRLGTNRSGLWAFGWSKFFRELNEAL